MKSKIIFLSLFTFCLIFVACNKDEETIDVQYPLAPEQTVDQNIETLSKLLASAMYGNTEFKSVIKEEIGYRFDHDYDALLLTFLGKTIAGKAFEELLAESSNGKYKPADVVRMIKKSGYLHMSIPVHFEAFDPAKDELMVFPIASMVEENVAEELEAFDHLGNRVRFSAKEAPKVPVLVVMRSERVDKDGLLSVNEYGLVLPKEERIHFKEAIDISKSMLKSARVRKHIVEIVSDEEYEESRKKSQSMRNTIETISIENTNLKSVPLNSQDNIYLTATTVNAYNIELTWLPYPGADRIEIWRDGEYIKTVYNTNGTHDIVPHANQTYTYHIKYYAPYGQVHESNRYFIQSSHRRKGGAEYLTKVKATSRMVVELEGWWVGDLEIDVNLFYVDGNQILNKPKKGFPIGTSGSGAWSRYVDYDGYKYLFNWNLSDNFNVYKATFVESDGETNKKKTVTLIVEIMELITTIVGTYNGIDIKEIGEKIKPGLTKILETFWDDKYIGDIAIEWTTPNGILQEINSQGFEVTIDHY